MTLARAFAARGVRLWVLVRLLVGVAVVLTAASGGRAAAVDLASAFLLAPPAALLVVPLTAALGLLDVARRGERALLGNLGVSRRRAAAWLAAPAVLGELLVALLPALAIGLAR